MPYAICYEKEFKGKKYKEKKSVMFGFDVKLLSYESLIS